MVEKNNTQALVLSVVIISVTLIIGIFILSQMQTTFRTTNSTLQRNESGFINSTGYTLENLATVLGFSNPSITVIINGSSGQIIQSGNYTLSNNVLRNATAQIWPSANISYNYDYLQETNTSFQSGNLVNSISNGIPWITIIIVVGFAVIVLGLLTKGFRDASESRIESPAY